MMKREINVNVVEMICGIIGVVLLLLLRHISGNSYLSIPVCIIAGIPIGIAMGQILLIVIESGIYLIQCIVDRIKK